MQNDLKFYERLKKKREALDKSLDEISDEIKIDTKFLEALEEGNFDVLPNTYIRLFLKTYAGELKLDIENILDEYDAYCEEHNIEAKEEEEIERETEEESKLNIEPTTKKKNISTIIITILALVFLIFLLKQIFNEDNKSKNDDLSPIDTTTVPIDQSDTSDNIKGEKNKEKTTGTDDTTKELKSTIDSSSINQTQNLNLEASFTDTCWVRIIIDQADTTEAIYYNNNQGTWEGEEKLRMEIGNPNGVSNLLLNGRSLGSVGKDVPVILHINREGIYRRTTLD